MEKAHKYENYFIAKRVDILSPDIWNHQFFLINRINIFTMVYILCIIIQRSHGWRGQLISNEKLSRHSFPNTKRLHLWKVGKQSEQPHNLGKYRPYSFSKNETLISTISGVLNDNWPCAQDLVLQHLTGPEGSAGVSDRDRASIRRYSALSHR